MKILFAFSLSLFSFLSSANAQLPLGDPVRCFSDDIFVRGDSDGDGIISLTDAIVILGYLFTGGDSPPCIRNADADGDGRLTITDPMRILNFLFLGGLPPVIPLSEDFDFTPYLFPLSPQENPAITLEFQSSEDSTALQFYPANIIGDVACTVNAISEAGEEIHLFDASLDEISEFFPLHHSFGFNDPLEAGSYVIRSECTGRGRGGIAEGRLIISENPPEQNIDYCPLDSAICCRKDFSSGPAYYCLPVNELDPRRDELQELVCDDPDDWTDDGQVLVDNGCCGPEGCPVQLKGSSEDNAKKLLLQASEPPAPAEGFCKVKCATVMRRGLTQTAECPGGVMTFTFPKEKFEALGRGEPLGFGYVYHTADDIARVWYETGVQGFGSNKGYITKFRGPGPVGDPDLLPEEEGKERLGYGFVFAAAYVGVDAQGNEFGEVNPKKCREYQFVQAKFEDNKRDSQDIVYPAVSPKNKADVSGVNSKSLLEWDREGLLTTRRELYNFVQQNSWLTSAGQCSLFSPKLCDDDYYRDRNQWDYTQFREFNFNLYDPNIMRSIPHFMKRFDLSPEDGIKKMFYWDNPGSVIKKLGRHMLKTGELISVFSETNFVMVAENEKGDGKIECKIDELSFYTEKGDNPANPEESKKIVGPPFACRCTEYSKEGGSWRILGSWDC